MSASRTEINMKRLLLKCEEMALDDRIKDWRFDKYLDSLENLLKDLNKSLPKSNLDQFQDYSKKLEFLRKASLSNVDSDNDINIGNSTFIVTNDIKSKQIYHKIQSNEDKQLRDELFGSNDQEETTDLDLDKIITLEQQQQDKIANEMIEAAMNLKGNSLIVQDILKKDNKELNEITTLADKNEENLKRETERIDKHVRSSFDICVWVLVFMIIFIFLMVVLFMKLFPKKQYSTYYETSSHNNAIFDSSMPNSNGSVEL